MRARVASGDWGRVVGDLRTVARGKPFRVALAISVLIHATLFAVVRFDPAGFAASRGARMLHLHLIEEAPEPMPPIAAAAPEPSVTAAPAKAPIAAKAQADERPGVGGGAAAEAMADMAATDSVAASASLGGAAPAVDALAVAESAAAEATATEAVATEAPATAAAPAGADVPAPAGVRASVQGQPAGDGVAAGFAATPPALAADAGHSGGAGAPDILAVRRRIDARKVYPRVAVRNGWEGRVLVEMLLDGEGGLKTVRVVEGSGHPVLDEATIASVRRASPFPPVAGTITVPVEYRLTP